MMDYIDLCLSEYADLPFKSYLRVKSETFVNK
jgi:hypothetical protein